MNKVPHTLISFSSNKYFNSSGIENITTKIKYIVEHNGPAYCTWINSFF